MAIVVSKITVNLVMESLSGNAGKGLLWAFANSMTFFI